MADANMRWTVEQAIRAGNQLREYNLFWLEEPTIPDDYDGHGRIAREGGVPLATGENLHTVYEFQHIEQTLQWRSRNLTFSILAVSPIGCESQNTPMLTT